MLHHPRAIALSSSLCLEALALDICPAESLPDPLQSLLKCRLLKGALSDQLQSLPYSVLPISSSQLYFACFMACITLEHVIIYYLLFLLFIIYLPPLAYQLHENRSTSVLLTESS